MNTANVNGVDLITKTVARMGDRWGFWGFGQTPEASVYREENGFAVEGIGFARKSFATATEAASAFAAAFPDRVDFIVSGEVQRLRWIAERVQADQRRAAQATAWFNTFFKSIRVAMRAAKCTAKVWIEPSSERSSYGDYDGFKVVADSKESMLRAAKWALAYDQKDYEARGGKYGGCTYDRQRVYSVHESSIKEISPGVWQCFAAARYVSCGD